MRCEDEDRKDVIFMKMIGTSEKKGGLGFERLQENCQVLHLEKTSIDNAHLALITSAFYFILISLVSG